MVKEDLQRLRTWADAQIVAGEEPTWIWYQFMKLREALDAIIAQMGMESVAFENERFRQISRRSECGPRLVLDNNRCERIQTDGLQAEERLGSQASSK